MVSLSWQFKQSILLLKGDLTEGTLTPLWQQRHTFLDSVTRIDLVSLTRVDSAGLALLINFHQAAARAIQCTGAGEQVNQLLDLYNLHDLIT